MFTRRCLLTWILAAFTLGVIGTSPPAPGSTTRLAAEDIRILFLYGSEKEKWIASATKRFNELGKTIPGGRRIVVVARTAGSGEMIEELTRKDDVDADWQAHLISPAGGAFIDRGNFKAHEAGKEDLISATQVLVRSPIVVAMWRDMAEAIGWGKRPISWLEIFDYARDQKKWQAAVKRPEWGAFKFGHTHPDFSNSGLHVLFAEVYAALGKFDGVTRRDIVEHRDEVDRYLREVENSVVHYGSSTGTFAKRMNAQGRDYLYAAVLYENLVIEANLAARSKASRPGPSPIVAIYPSEGTFPSEHPVGVIRRPWVADAHRQAAEIYIAFLLEKPQQEEAKKFGFRPSDSSIPLDDLLIPALGVDPTEPKKAYLKPPPASVFDLIGDSWSRNKRPADIVLAIDNSGSMKGEKIRRVEAAAKTFLDMLRDGDVVSTLIFGAEVEWQAKNIKISEAGKIEAKKSIDVLTPGGDTALYQSILEAQEYLSARDPTRNRAIVLLSDGNDSKRKTTLDEVLKKLKIGKDEKPIYVFTIAYGKDANPTLLETLSRSTQGEAFSDTDELRSDAKSIRDIFVKIATFF